MTDETKLPLTSSDVTAEVLAQLREIAPQVFTEGGVDFEKLKATLGESIVPKDERYGLSWAGKSEAFRNMQIPSVGTLLPQPEESVNFDTSENLIIEGDNLEVLKLLQKSYHGKVKMIYIDPPYNTGNEFIYPDNFHEGLDDYLKYSGQVNDEGQRNSSETDTTGRFHSKWLNMMYPRLFLARNLLRDDGVIFVSIDDNEVQNLRMLLNEVFGEENFLASFIWHSKLTGGHDAKDVNKVHEYILCYAKGSAMRGNFLANLDSGTEYPQWDEEKGQSYKWDSLWTVSHGYTANCDYPIPAPDGSDVYPWMCHKDGVKAKGVARWFWSKETYEADKEMTLVKKVDTQWKVYKRVYGGSGTPIQSFLDKEKVGGTGNGKKELEELIGSGIFDNPKPTALIGAFLERCPDDSLVLDFFAGSGTTADAVLKSNQSDYGSRRFILVQLPEKTTNPSFPNISHITRHRIKEVIRKLNKEDGGEGQDRGFKALKLTSSNFKIWNADTTSTDAEAISEQLRLYADNVERDRTQQDILFELVLKSGLPLSAKVEQIKVSGRPVFSIAQGQLLICLEQEINQAVLRGMIALTPIQIVCLDRAFGGNDQMKTNIALEAKSQDVTFRTV